MLHGLLWLPLIFIFFLLTALGWLERRRQNLFRNWANGSELCKLDSSGAAYLKGGKLTWSAFEAGEFKEKESFIKFTQKNGIMTRPTWTPMHKLQIYKGSFRDDLENTEWISDRLVNVPSSPITQHK